MIDFPIDELLDDGACTAWLERQLHPEGLRCPHCRCAERRVSRRTGHFLGYRCKGCDRYFTLLSGTAFARSRQRPAKLVFMLRGIAKGEPTARLARALELARSSMHAVRKKVQTNLSDTLDRSVLDDEVLFEADEVYLNAGEKGEPHTDPADPPRRRANKRRGLGTWEGDRPPVFGVWARETGVVRSFVREKADSATCLEVISSTVPRWSGALFTDAWAGDTPLGDELHILHGSVRHGSDERGPREWARDDDGGGWREVHGTSCEGSGAALRTYLRPSRGVHKTYLRLYVACYEAMANAKRITSAVLRRMCFGTAALPTNHT